MPGRTTRRSFVAAAGGLLAGCSGDTGPVDGTAVGGSAAETTDGTVTTDRDSSDDPTRGDAQQVGDLRLSSPAFGDGDPIPAEYGRGARNVNPPLRVENVPPAASSLVLVMDDPDAREPAGKVWLHWLVWNVPPGTTQIPEDWDPTEAVEGINDFDERGYGGPAPPDDVHTYRFKLYALDASLDLPASADKPAVGDAMTGHVVEQTQLTGTYAPQ